MQDVTHQSVSVCVLVFVCELAKQRAAGPVDLLQRCIAVAEFESMLRSQVDCLHGLETMSKDEVASAARTDERRGGGTLLRRQFLCARDSEDQKLLHCVGLRASDLHALQRRLEEWGGQEWLQLLGKWPVAVQRGRLEVDTRTRRGSANGGAGRSCIGCVRQCVRSRGRHADTRVRCALGALDEGGAAGRCGGRVRWNRRSGSGARAPARLHLCWALGRGGRRAGWLIFLTQRRSGSDRGRRSNGHANG